MHLGKKRDTPRIVRKTAHPLLQRQKGPLRALPCREGGALRDQKGPGLVKRGTNVPCGGGESTKDSVPGLRTKRNGDFMITEEGITQKTNHSEGKRRSAEKDPMQPTGLQDVQRGPVWTKTPLKTTLLRGRGRTVI